MFIKKSKCSFVQSKVEYLGHLISAKGVETDTKKVEVIAVRPIPKTIKELRSYLGLTGYYRKFIPNYALICKPSHDILKKGNVAKKQTLAWSESAQDFETLT